MTYFALGIVCFIIGHYLGYKQQKDHCVNRVKRGEIPTPEYARENWR